MWPFKSKKQKREEEIELIKKELEREDRLFKKYLETGWGHSNYKISYQNKQNLLRAKLCMLESLNRG